VANDAGGNIPSRSPDPGCRTAILSGALRENLRVDDAFRPAFFQNGNHAFGHVARKAGEGLVGATGHMRRQQQARRAVQPCHLFRRRRLGFEYVGDRRFQLACVQSGNEVRLHHHTAARRIDQHTVRPDEAQLLAAQQAARRRQQRHVD